MQSQRKNRRRTSNPLVLRTVIVFFILAAVGTILCTLPIFNVKEITTSSLRLLLPDDILRTANLPTGENIFLMRFGNAKKKLEKIQSIKKVDFHRMIPDVIQIRITERKEVAVTILDGQSTLVDDQGYIFTPTIFPDITHLPVLSGLKKAWIKEGRLSGEVGGQLIKLLSEFKNFIMPSKLQVNISDLQEIDLLADDTLRVRIGDANNLDKKIKLFETIFSRIKDKKDKIEYIDLRFPLFPVVKYK